MRRSWGDALARDHRRLAAIVSADVVGYSLLMGRDDSATLAGLKAHRRELIDPKIAEYGGRIVKTTGDGLLLEFPSVVDAVRCAVDVQRGMAERNAGVPPDQRIEFRIGINVGDIIIDGDDIFGDGVNVAARLQTLAEPGGICVSRVVRDQVLDKLSFAFEDLGAQQVKNIVRPVEAYRIRDDLPVAAAAQSQPVADQGRLTPEAAQAPRRRCAGSLDGNSQSLRPSLYSFWPSVWARGSGRSDRQRPWQSSPGRRHGRCWCCNSARRPTTCNSLNSPTPSAATLRAHSPTASATRTLWRPATRPRRRGKP